MTVKSLITITLLATLTGCSMARFHQPQNPATQPKDAVAVQLAEAAASVSDSLNDLAAIERATKPVSRVLVNPNDAQMPGAISLDWAGPVEPLLQRLASISGYKLRVLGTKPAIPVIITLTAKNTPLSYVVRDIDFQCGKKAQLILYPQAKVLELRYSKG